MLRRSRFPQHHVLLEKLSVLFEISSPCSTIGTCVIGRPPSVAANIIISGMELSECLLYRHHELSRERLDQQYSLRTSVRRHTPGTATTRIASALFMRPIALRVLHSKTYWLLQMIGGRRGRKGMCNKITGTLELWGQSILS